MRISWKVRSALYATCNDKPQNRKSVFRGPVDLFALPALAIASQPVRHMIAVTGAAMQIAFLRRLSLPPVIRLAGILFRSIIIILLIVVTFHVAMPQTVSFSTAYERPSEIIRIGLGLACCLWLFSHIFILPKDADGYRVWMYLGIILLPFALLCAVVIW